MAIISNRFPDWCNREVDQFGRTIRVDVRDAVPNVWRTACRHAQMAVGDAAEAVDLMEATVSQISAYLENAGVPLYHPDQDIPALLIKNFLQALRRREIAYQRLELPGNIETPDSLDWEHEVNLQLDFKRLYKHLSPRGREIVLLRNIGYDWKFIAKAHGISVGRAKHVYARELEKARRALGLTTDPDAPDDNEKPKKG